MGGPDRKSSPYVLNPGEWPSFEEALLRTQHIGLRVLSRIPGFDMWTRPRLARNEARDMIAWSMFKMDDVTKSFRLALQAQAGYRSTAATVGEFQLGNGPFPLTPSDLRSMGDEMRAQGARRVIRDINRRLPLLQNAARTVLADENERREATAMASAMHGVLADGLTPGAIQRMRGIVSPAALSLHVPERIYPDVFQAALAVADNPGERGFASTSEALDGCLGAAGLPEDARAIVRDYMLAGIEANHITTQLGN